MPDLREEIYAWMAAGRLRPADAPRALAAAGLTPGAAEWRRFVESLLLWSGVALTASGVIYFFAYNWSALSRMAKFGIAEGLFAAAFLIAAWLGRAHAGGRAALFLASLLMGALFALFGQTYQTGADSYALFTTWAIALLPWAVVARFAPLWLLWLAIANTATVTYFQATRWGLLGFLFGFSGTLYLMLALNLAALVAWEWGITAKFDWLPRWGARAIGLLAGGVATFLGVTAILEMHESAVGFFVYALVIAAMLYYYRSQVLDIFLLSGGLLSVIVVASALLIRAFPHNDSGGLLFIGVAIIAMSAAGGAWIRNIAQGAEQ